MSGNQSTLSEGAGVVSATVDNDDDDDDDDADRDDTADGALGPAPRSSDNRTPAFVGFGCAPGARLTGAADGGPPATSEATSDATLDAAAAEAVLDAASARLPVAPDAPPAAAASLPAAAPRGGVDGVLRPGIVHRLDKGTSGLLVLAKCEVAHRALCEQFKQRTVDRTYLSLAVGVPQARTGRCGHLHARVACAYVEDVVPGKLM
eukprot:357115-Chlamydomonas_euryale.AAC.4